MFVRTLYLVALTALAPATPTESPNPEPVGVLAEQETMAERWGRTARVALDMPSTTFFSQIPDNVSGAGFTGTLGDLREHTITWPDGSVVVTYWRQSPRGLLLDYIGKVGRLAAGT